MITINIRSLKYWSCCAKKKTHDFNEFLEMPGCTQDKHRWFKPVDELTQEKPCRLYDSRVLVPGYVDMRAVDRSVCTRVLVSGNSIRLLLIYARPSPPPVLHFPYPFFPRASLVFFFFFFTCFVSFIFMYVF